MKLKVLIIVLAVLLVLYVVGVGMSGCNRREISGDAPGWIKGLGGGDKPKPTVSPNDIESSDPNCVTEYVNGTISLNVGQTCVLTVTKSSRILFPAPIRRLPLKLTPVATALVEVDPVEKNRFDTTLRLPNPTTEPQIFRQGGVVTITCQGASPQCLIGTVSE